MTVLKAIEIKKNFGGVQALVNGRIELSAGRITGLLGANGSGKSTISKIICGIHQPSSGRIIIDGHDVQVKSPEQARELGIVMIHQHLSLLPELKVWQNIMLGREECKSTGFLADKSNFQIATEALNKLRSEIDPNMIVRNLSPADRQIVEIAKALVQKPRILILDEPTAALEHTQVQNLFDILNDLKNTEKTAMVFISHRMREVVQICDDICVFRNGDTVGHIDLQTDIFDEDLVISLITGKPRKQQEESCCQNTGMPICLEIKDLKIKGFRGEADFTVHHGEILGIAGLSGQGQEELLTALAGCRKIHSGIIRINGKNINMSNPRAAVRSGIVLVPGDRQEEGIFIDHTIRDNLMYPLHASANSNLFSLSRREHIIAKNLIERMNIQPQDDMQVIRFLSGGNQQKAVVGKWLNLKPELLLLSDPAKGVDVDAKEEMYRVVEQLAASGTAVILYASDNEELVRVCHRVLVLFEGNIVAELCGNQISDEVITEASLGLQTLDSQSNYSKSLNVQSAKSDNDGKGVLYEDITINRKNNQA